MTTQPAAPISTEEVRDQEFTEMFQELEHLRALVANKPSTEEASTNVFWTAGNKEIFNFQTTVRGALTDEQLWAHLDTAIRLGKLITAHEGHAKQVGQPASPPEGQPPAPRQAGQPAQAARPAAPPAPGRPATPPAPGQPPAPTAQAAPPAGASNGTGEIFTLPIVKWEVAKIRQDGRVDINFFGPGHRHPDIYTTWSVEKAVQMFAETGAWTAEHFAGAQTYTFPLKVLYTLGKANSKGNQYKDILRLEPA